MPEAESNAVNLLAVLTPRAGQVERLREVLRNMVLASRQEDGCLRYDLLEEDVGGSARFHVVERYTNDTAVAAHGASEHYRALSAQFGELLAHIPEVVRARDVDVHAG